MKRQSSGGIDLNSSLPALFILEEAMKLTHALVGILSVVMLSQTVSAQDFGSPWSRPARYASDFRNPQWQPGYKNDIRNAAFWGERDPGYVSNPKVARTAYRPARPAGYQGYRGPDANYSAYRAAADRRGYPVPPKAVPGYGKKKYGKNYGQYGKKNFGFPKNYYKGDGLFGQDTVYAKDQPIRNAFRYLLP